MANTTWSTTDRTGSVTLSNGNRTIATAATSQGARSIDGLTAGKFYYEVTATTWPVGGYFGLANSSAVLSTAGSNGTNCVYLTQAGVLWVNNVNAGNILGSRANGDIIGIAFDLAARLIWLRATPSGNWNGSGTANPATGVGGININTIGGGATALYALFCNSASTAMSFTGNFGDLAFNGAVPAGFTGGIPAAGGAGTQTARVAILV